MKIKISFSLEGPDQWSDTDSGWGQTMAQSHSFEVDFGEDTRQIEAIACAIRRLINAVDPPRLSQLLAEIIDPNADEVCNQEPCEKALSSAARKVLDYWESLDDELNKLCQPSK